MSRSVIVAGCDETNWVSLRDELGRRQFEVLQLSIEPGIASFARRSDAIGVILCANGDNADSVLGSARAIRENLPWIPILFVTEISSEDLAIEAFHCGISDYHRRPVTSETIAASLQKLFQHCRSDPAGEVRPQSKAPTRAMIGNSPAMQGIADYLRRVANADSNILVTGETGTGKELVAELIHMSSPRKDRPLVRINCAAIPDSLVESELFGHERGAFTGAHASREGQLRLAEGGSLFLDEIGEMSPYAQAKILRAVETKEIRRVGGSQPISVNIRVIAATSRNLDQMVTDGTFREDLYFRLDVIRIEIPPLRDRKSDIPLLIQHHVKSLNEKFGCHVEGLTDDLIQSLIHYNWPGNVRELGNLLEAVFAQYPRNYICLGDLPARFREKLSITSRSPVHDKEKLLTALLSTNWNKTKAAEKLHWSRMTLYRKMSKYNLGPAEPRAKAGPSPKTF